MKLLLSNTRSERRVALFWDRNLWWLLKMAFFSCSRVILVSSVSSSFLELGMEGWRSCFSCDKLSRWDVFISETYWLLSSPITIKSWSKSSTSLAYYLSGLVSLSFVVPLLLSVFSFFVLLFFIFLAFFSILSLSSNFIICEKRVFWSTFLSWSVKPPLSSWLLPSTDDLL